MRHSALRQLFIRPDWDEFRLRFEEATSSASVSEIEELRTMGAEAFQAFLESQPEHPESRLLRWFAEQYDSGRIAETDQILSLIRRLEKTSRRDAERRRYAAFEPRGAVIQTQRVVQLSWFGFAGFQASDVFEVRRSVFRSPQEREFSAAAKLRFPGLAIMPNYPLRAVVDLDKLADLLPGDVIRYGRRCLLDVLLATPREGDPVAAFELDSKRHDDPHRKQQDEWKTKLMAVAHIPLFRLRSEDPSATSVDEWYSILSDEVLDKIDCGARIRTRDVHTTLVPIAR